MKLKKIMSILLSSALLLTLAACNTTENNPPKNTNNTGNTGNSTNSGEKTEAGTNKGSSDSSSTNSPSTSPETLPPMSEEAPPTVSDLNDYGYADSAADSPYVIDNGITDRMVALSEMNIGNKVRLANAMKKAAAGEEITVAFIGGSITQGTSAGDDGCYAKLVDLWFEDTFKNATVNYVKAGIGATGSYIGVHRAQRDVISKNPDIVFVEFSVNDTTENTRRNVDSYDSLLRMFWNSESKPALVCIGMTQENGTSFQNYHYDIAKSYDLPFISYRNAILDVIDKGHITWKDISDDNIHPNVAGHKVLAQIITHYLEKVNSEKDSITGDESDFSTPYSKDRFANAKLLTPNEIEGTDESGSYVCMKDNTFSNFTGNWTARGGIDSSAKLVFKDVEAKNIGLLYGEFLRGGPVLDVYIDGKLAAQVDEKFPSGWGNYAEAVQIASFEESGKHTIEIVPEITDDVAMSVICGLLVS